MPGKAIVTGTTRPLERRIRIAASLISLGLLTLLITLLRIHPLAFVAFIVIGCPLVLAGILLFLHSVMSHDNTAI